MQLVIIGTLDGQIGAASQIAISVVQKFSKRTPPKLALSFYVKVVQILL